MWCAHSCWGGGQNWQNWFVSDLSVLLGAITWWCISDAIDLLGLSEDLMADSTKVEAPTKKVTPEEFLGPNAKLVDFDDLISKPTPASEFRSVLLICCKFHITYCYWCISSLMLLASDLCSVLTITEVQQHYIVMSLAWCCSQALWIHLLWRSASRQQLRTRSSLVQRKKSRVAEFPLVSCSRLGRLAYQPLRQRSGRHWPLSTHHSLYHRSTATTLSCEVDGQIPCWAVFVVAASVVLCCLRTASL